MRWQRKRLKGCGSLTCTYIMPFWSGLALRVLGGREKTSCLFMSHYCFGFSVTCSLTILTEICKNKNRNKKVMCVVEEPKNIILIEKLNIFDGYYHVLDGLISPIDGINPEDLNIDALIERVKKNKVEELILALKPSIEGETTSLYISKLLEDSKVKITKLAYGIPLGAEIDYVDSLTLEMALENRMDITTNKDS